MSGKNSREDLLWTNNEYPIPLFVSSHDGKSRKAEAQIIAQKLGVGGSAIHLKQEVEGWKRVPGSSHTRRLPALYPQMEVSGAASTVVPHATGTLANCWDGRTPWNTVLSCEENFQDYNQKWRWTDVPEHAIDENRDGTLYVPLTNNARHGNFYGQILRLLEKTTSPEARRFVANLSRG